MREQSQPLKETRVHKSSARVRLSPAIAGALRKVPGVHPRSPYTTVSTPSPQGMSHLFAHSMPEFCCYETARLSEISFDGNFE